VRIGILEAETTLGRPTSETSAAVHQAAKYLEQLGFSVEPFRSTNLDALLEEALALWWFFFGRYVAQFYHNHYLGQESQFSPMFCDYLYAAESSGPITREEIAQSIAAREILYKKILQAIQPTQILLSPVCLSPAFRHAEGHWREMGGYRETMRHSQWLNLAGLPGLSLPMAISAEGLPIGIQLIANPNQEELLLAVAAQLENARGPWQLPPPQL
jgi:Asp-tRNA(Asn)/Glu-tRNA(Gln) amidotransferase A subunit family amidase